MTEFGVVRELSEGIPRIYEEMSKYFLDEPEFEVDSVDNFILTLKNNYIARDKNEEESLRKNENIDEEWEDLSEIERKIIQLISDRGEISIVDIVKYMERSDSTIRRLLRKLEQKGLIYWYGTSKYDPKKVYKICEPSQK